MPGRAAALVKRRGLERPAVALVSRVGEGHLSATQPAPAVTVPCDPSTPTVVATGASTSLAEANGRHDLTHKDPRGVPVEIIREDKWKQRVPFRNRMEMHVLAVQKLASGRVPIAGVEGERVNLLDEVDWGRTPTTWEGLKPTTLKLAENLTVRQIAILLNAYAKAGVADRQIFYTLTQQFSGRIDSSPKSVLAIRAQDVGLVAHACQKMQFKNEFLFTKLRKVVVRMVRQNRPISPQTLSLILTGFVKLNFIGDGDLLHSLGTAALRELHHFTIRDSAVLMMTFSQACPLDHQARDVFRTVYKNRDRVEERDNMAAAVPIMVSLGKLGAWHPELVQSLLLDDSAVVEAFAAAVPTCAVIHLANGIQALGTLVASGLLPPAVDARPSFRAASDRLCEDQGTRLPQSAIVQLAAGYTKLGGIGWQDIFLRIVKDSQGLDLPSAVAVLHGLAGQNIRDCNWVDREILARSQLPGLRDPQSVCMLVYALARLGMPVEATVVSELLTDKVLRGLGVQGLSNLVYAMASVWHSCGLSGEEQDRAAMALVRGLERLSIVGSEEDQLRYSLEIAGQLRVAALLSMPSVADMAHDMDLLKWIDRLVDWSAGQKPNPVKSSFLHKEVASALRVVLPPEATLAEEIPVAPYWIDILLSPEHADTCAFPFASMAATTEPTAPSGGPPIDTFSGPAFGFLSNDHESSVRAFCPGRDETTVFAEFPTAAAAVSALREGLDPDVWKKNRLKLVTTVLRDKFARHPELADELVATGKRSLLFDCSPDDADAFEAQGFPTDEGVFWACSRDTGALKGQNQLGRILSTIRTDLQDSQETARQLWLHSIMSVVKQDTASPIRLTEVKEGRSVGSHNVSNAVCVMGKLDTCDVVALHPSTSRHHALLVYAAGFKNPTDSKWRENALDKVYAMDLNSKFGTFVGEKGDVKLEPFLPRPIGKRDQLRLGASTRHYEIKVDHAAALKELRQMEYKLDKEIRDMGGKIDNPTKEADEERSKTSGSMPVAACLRSLQEQEDIENFFKQENLEVHRVRIPGGDDDNMASRGFAFVEFSRESDMRNAIALLDGATLDTRKIKLKVAEERQQRPRDSYRRDERSPRQRRPSSNDRGERRRRYSRSRSGDRHRRRSGSRSGDRRRRRSSSRRRERSRSPRHHHQYRD
ncbi:hypothetical protein FOL47_010935 [Perkinsus chesapeaki]|uniref:Uncharacterized protein n=1 Tax=Perkinsus chesapeaki TaxID=330153 RepID=A0A7J6N235_PERCH|nr:hypothetical protein FOL47_010935 [Perkinsus chesapeaki]